MSKLETVIYLLTYTECSIQYFGESITSAHKRMNIQRRGKFWRDLWWKVFNLNF